MQTLQAPPQRVDQPPEDRWRKCPEHVLVDIKRFDRRLHIWWHAGEGAWQVLEFLERSLTWSHVSFWRQPYPTSLGILTSISHMDQINNNLRHVQDFEASCEKEKEKVKAATLSEREYLKKHALLDWADRTCGKFTTSFNPTDRPRAWKPLELPTDIRI